MGYKKELENELMYSNFDLGERLKAFRMSRNISQVELAALMRVYQKDISRWENNICVPSVFLVKKYCEVLKISADDLLDIRLD